MSEEENDLYYDAFSVAPHANTDPQVYWNDPQATVAADSEGNHVTAVGHQATAEQEYGKTQTETVGSKTASDGSNRVCDSQADLVEIDGDATGERKRNKVLANVAKFEAVGKDTVPLRTSPVPNLRASPVPNARLSPVPNIQTGQIARASSYKEAVRNENIEHNPPLHSTDFSKELESVLKPTVSRGADSGPEVERTGVESWEAWEAVNAGIPALENAAENVSATEGSSIHVVSDANAPRSDWGEWEAMNATYSSAPAEQNTTRNINVVDASVGALATGGDATAVYCLAQPFPDDESGAASTDHRQQVESVHAVAENRISVDSFGYSRARKTHDDNDTPGPASENCDTAQAPSRNVTEDTALGAEAQGLAYAGQDHSNDANELHADFEQTIYDSVCSDSSGRTLDRSEVCDFEIVQYNQVGEVKDGEKSQTKDDKEGGKKTKEFGSHNWSRKAKFKSRALKRSTKDAEHPFVGHHEFKDPHKGAVPELEEEDGIMEALSPFNMHGGNSSGSSYISDSSFDSPISDYSDDNEDDKRIASTVSYSNKPLPPVPNKKKVNSQNEEDGMVLERVKLKRPRDAPSLPDAPDGLTQIQMKMRGVLQSLVENERNYISSLQRVVEEYKKDIVNQYLSRNKEVKVTFDRVEDILNIHKMFEIELAAKLKIWYTKEEIGHIFLKFSSQLVIDSYSGYVNNFEATCETIRELENSRQNFKEFLKSKQLSSPDRLSLSGLMLKPVQRFPQLIMIIKDLLKYTQRDHHDREPLQEALTGIENVAHQLNERKRRTEQYFLGQQIVSKLAPRIHIEKNSYLIRQDDMDQLSQDGAGGHTTKQRRLFLMNDKIISVHVAQRDQDGSGPDRFTYKWHQSLRELELTTSAITPNMHTRVHAETKSTAIFSPKTDAALEEDPYSVASELTDMMHDVPVLAQISQLVSSLKLQYQTLTEDHIQEILTGLQREIQGKDYQLQMLNSSSIILQDKARKKKYVFSAANANMKQEWCTDFLMAKYALDIVNIPSWHQHDMKGTNLNQPSLLTKHMSVDMQRTFTKIKCGVRVFFPTRNEGSVEHLWISSSTELVGQVSIVSLHTAKPSLVESFQATRCEIVCVEMVPGFALVSNDLAFPEDSVWMSTVDSEILVFMFSEQKSDSHRQPTYRFNPGFVVISMTYVDDKVFCGSRGGLVLVYSRNDDGIWSYCRQIQLGSGAVTSMICVSDNLWVACGSQIHVIDPDTCKLQRPVENQMDDPDLHVQFLVKAGVGVWASFHGKPYISLFHSESRRLLQELSICNAINEFIQVYTGDKPTSRNYEVTCLMASLGLLWVGTNVGIILTYHLPRLRDGVPRINTRPQVALHGHNGPIRFLIPVHYGPVSAVPIRRRPSSILGRSNVDKMGMRKMPKVDEKSAAGQENMYISLDAEAMAQDAGGENIYEAVDYGKQGVSADLKSKGDEKKSSEGPIDFMNSDEHKYFRLEPQTNEFVPVEPVATDKGFTLSDEHKYFILEPQSKQFVPVDNVPVSPNGKQQTSANKPAEKSVEVQGKPADTKTVPKNAKGDTDIAVVHRQRKPSQDRPYSVDHLTDLRDSAEGVALRETSGRQLGQPKTMFNQSVDSLDAVFKPAKLPGMANQPVMPVKFRSELKNKLKMRKSQENLIDLAVTKDEMGRLYGTLMRPTGASNGDSALCTSLPSNYSLDSSTSESTYVRPRTTIAIAAKKPDISATRFSSKKKTDSPKSPKEDSSKASIKKRMSAPPSPGPATKPSVGSSFSSGGTIDTLRKQNSNTILMLSGGDGYKDWKKRQSLQSYRPEEPCLIFWMYKC